MPLPPDDDIGTKKDALGEFKEFYNTQHPNYAPGLKLLTRSITKRNVPLRKIKKQRTLSHRKAQKLRRETKFEERH